MGSLSRQDDLSPRAEAASLLCSWMEREAFPDRLLQGITTSRAFVMELVYGVVRRRRVLDWYVDRLVQRSPALRVRAVLWVGLYQLLFLDEVETYAAVHESVAAARALGVPRAAGLVNAVLRRVLREREHLAQALSKEPLAVRLSHPDELVERWSRQFGPSETEDLCRWNNQRADVTLRPVGGRASAAAFQARLREAGIEAEPHPYNPDRFFVLPRGIRVSDVPGFQEGAFVVQDPATCVAPDLLHPAPGEHVLDGCAAPGGKTILLAEAMAPPAGPAPAGSLTACDLHADRLPPLHENLARLDHGWVRVERLDLTNPEEVGGRLGERAQQGFDCILLDVPCSNTGVIRRRPDARYRVSRARLDTLVSAQQRLLSAAAELLAPQGRMVYSTCSLEPEENGEGVRQWLENHPDMGCAKEQFLFPPASGTDGAYAALLTTRS